jgi:hypothetical protein
VADGMITACRCILVALSAALLICSPAYAADKNDLQAQLTQMQKDIEAQKKLIEEQEARIRAQQLQIDQLQESLSSELDIIRGGGLGGTQATAATATKPVGEAPPKDVIGRAEVEAIPRELGVLTPKGNLVFDPSIEYTRSSADRLVFRGIELVPGIQLGLIEASNVDRDTLIGTAALRYGITDRLEIEGRLPYVYRNDSIKVVEQRDDSIVRTIHLKGNDIGDAEATIRYQLNSVRPLRPIWIASLRVKSATGRGPFEIPFDEFGVATGLATGSGFWGIEPGISFLLPSDPVVIYGGVSYLYHVAKNINRTVGDVHIGRVNPGDAIETNIGFGFAVNPQFSFSLGYRHDYLFPTKEEINDTVQKSDKLHVGRLTLGMAYRMSEKQVINLGFEFGVTKEAPDMSVTLRFPLTIFD